MFKIFWIGGLCIRDTAEVTDELLIASSMVSWLIQKFQNEANELISEFELAGDATGGEGFWVGFRTILVKLLLAPQNFICHDVYLDEISAVS
jgi:hypothetical protein